MNLSDLLVPDTVLVPFEAPDKWRAIGDLAAATVAAGLVPPAKRDDVEAALVQRERRMTTGMEHGVAIPHAPVHGLDRTIAILGISRGGIPFESLDGAPARIVVGLVMPPSAKLQHIKTLAEIARLLGQQEVRDRLLACSDAASALELVRAEAGRGQAAP